MGLVGLASWSWPTIGQHRCPSSRNRLVRGFFILPAAHQDGDCCDCDWMEEARGLWVVTDCTAATAPPPPTVHGYHVSIPIIPGAPPPRCVQQWSAWRCLPGQPSSQAATLAGTPCRQGLPGPCVRARVRARHCGGRCLVYR